MDGGHRVIFQKKKSQQNQNQKFINNNLLWWKGASNFFFCETNPFRLVMELAHFFNFKNYLFIFSRIQSATTVETEGSTFGCRQRRQQRRT